MAFLDTLGKGARAAWPFIQAGVEAGNTANEIYRQLQEAGMGARRADVLAAVREAAGNLLSRSDFTHYLVDQVPPIERIREASTKILAPYSYSLEVSLLEPYTQQLIKVTRTAHSSLPLSPEMAASAFMEDFAPEATYNGMVVVSATTVDMVRAGPAGVI